MNLPDQPQNDALVQIAPTGTGALNSNSEGFGSAINTSGKSISNALPDWLGLLASIGCAIHCAAMPFVIAFLPMLGLSFLADEAFHKVMVVVCTILAATAFIPGWRKHRKLLPIGIGAAGLCLIAVAAFALEGECCANCEKPQTELLAASGNTSQTKATNNNALTIGSTCDCECCDEPDTIANTADSKPGSSFSMLYLVTPLGGILLVTAHLTNRGFSCRCGCCDSTRQ